MFLLESTGRGPEAHRELKRALVTDALSVPLNTELGCNSYYQRHYDEAIRGYREALTLDAGKQLFVDPYLVATIYLALNDKPRTFEQLEKA